jgi:hypothetical protein
VFHAYNNVNHYASLPFGALPRALLIFLKKKRSKRILWQTACGVLERYIQANYQNYARNRQAGFCFSNTAKRYW